jgi:glycosyltransferase involved in cell wall biosynthesis
MAQKILFDGCVLSRPYAGSGIHRYTTNLIRGMEKLTATEGGPEFRVLLPSLADGAGDGWKARPHFIASPQPLMRFHRAWKYGLVNALAMAAGDAVFVPMPISVYLKPRRLAVTIHDVVPPLFPERYRSFMGRVFIHAYTSSMRKADLIFTDSECSKADMVSRFGVPAEKIVVAYLGYDRDAFQSGPAETPESRAMLNRFGITGPYVLHVGRGDPRKNLVRLVQAYKILTARRKDLDFQLVLGGSPGWGHEPLAQLLRTPSLRGKVIATGPVPDRELPTLYRCATCFAMPSLYEGFGLPVLEAMACGTPLMVSNASSLPEVGGDAALYFDPQSVDDMAEAMEKLITDSELREDMVRRGLERARQFSWEDCARTTLAALKRL